MGLQVSDANIAFNNPQGAVLMAPLSNYIRCIMHSFTVSFTFEFNARRGVPPLPPPGTKELWQVGIVQNVIREIMSFEYEDGSIIETSFTHAALDSAAQVYSPFYHDPVHTPLSVLTGLNTSQARRTYVPVMVPVREIWYTSQGYGELLNPWHQSEVSITNSPLTVDMLDEPRFGARMHRQGALVVRAEHILAFRIWVVARRQHRLHVLARVPAFSLVFWATMRPDPNLLSFGIPDHRFGFYGRQGIARAVDRRERNAPANIRIQLGAGGPGPTLAGETANIRGRQWLTDNNLLP